MGVLRYYKLHFQPYVTQIKTEAKSTKLSLQEKVTKLRSEQDQLAAKGKSDHLFVHTRDPSISGASLCESDKQAGAGTPDSIPSSDETIRNTEKWAFNFMKFVLSGAS